MLDKADEQKARLAAKRIGLIARRSRGGFALLDEQDRIVVGARLTPKGRA